MPCLVVSPFSRGGYVCGDAFDHSSILRLLETRFGVEVPNLTPWRRSVTGDLTSAFGFGEAPRLDVPVLPETSNRLEAITEVVPSLPRPEVSNDAASPASRTRNAAASRALIKLLIPVAISLLPWIVLLLDSRDAAARNSESDLVLTLLAATVSFVLTAVAPAIVLVGS